MCSQRLETLDPDLRCERASEEGQRSRACLAEAGDPPNASCEEPGRQHASSVVHDDGVDGPEKDSDEGDGDGTTDEGGDEPDHKLESVPSGVSAVRVGEMHSAVVQEPT